LELADHVAIVTQLPAALLGDPPRERLELATGLDVARERPIHQLARIHVDSEALEVVRIQLGRKPVRRTRARQHGLPRPLGIFVELTTQNREILLPAIEPAALQDLLD